jgi:hypothetical protein
MGLSFRAAAFVKKTLSTGLDLGYFELLNAA